MIFVPRGYISLPIPCIDVSSSVLTCARHIGEGTISCCPSTFRIPVTFERAAVVTASLRQRDVREGVRWLYLASSLLLLSGGLCYGVYEHCLHYLVSESPKTCQQHSLLERRNVLRILDEMNKAERNKIPALYLRLCVEGARVARIVSTPKISWKPT